MKNFTLCLLILYGFSASAQLTITNNVQTPAQLVQDVLVDPSVNPTNIKFNGSTINANTIKSQAAFFWTNFNPTNLGINEGVLLATGNAKVAEGPNNSGSAAQLPIGAATNDPDLLQVAGPTLQINNSAILEFDFVATGLELNFDYVFASEEFPEWTASPFNDVFGFFLSGPGLTGPFSNNAVNIARLPVTTTGDPYVSIGNVNNGTANSGPCENCAFYVNNGTGSTPVANPHLQYDGFTTVLRATSPLICGETYHIKLAVANVGSGVDNAYDSGVFLQNFRIKPFELLGNSGPGGSTGSGVPICPGEQVVIASGITDLGFTYDWSVDGVAIPGPHGPDLIVPPSNGPLSVTAGSLVTGNRYQILSVGTTDFTSIGAANNLPLEVFTATGPGTGDGVVAPVAVYELKYYTSSGCFLGSDTYDLAYINFGLRELPSIKKCFPESTTVPPQYSFGNLNVDMTDYILNGVSPGLFDIRFFDNPTDAYSPAPPAGLTQAQLSNYTVSSNQTIYILFESLTRGCFFVKEVDLIVDIKPDGSFSYGGPYCLSVSSAPVAPTLTNLTPGGTFNPSSAGLVVNPTTGEIDLAMSSPNSYTVNYHIPASGIACGVFDVSATVVITAAMPAPIVTDITYCQGEVPSALSVSGPGIMWYNSPVGGTGTTLAPTPSTNTPGITSYFVSQNGGCESPRAEIKVDVKAKPLPPLVTPPVYCQNDVAQSLALSVVGTNLQWYTSAIGGTASTTPPVVSTGAPGITTHYVSQKSSDGCESDRVQLDVTVNPLPVAPAGNITQPTCITPTGKIEITAPLGANLEYSIDNGTNYQPQAEFSLLAPNAPYSIIVRNTVTGCISAATVFNIQPAPTFPATPAVSGNNVCVGGQINLTTPAVAGATYSWTGPNGFTSSVQNPSIPNSTLAMSGTYSLVISTGPDCPSSPGTVNIVVNPLPSMPGVSPVAYCQNDAPSPLTAVGNNLLWYANLTGGTGSATPPPVSTLTPGITNYYVTQTSASGCESARAQLVVTVNALPAAPSGDIVQPTCTAATGTIRITGPVGANLEYSIDGGANYQPQTEFNLLTPNAPYSIIARNTVTGCVSAATTFNIQIAPTFPATPVVASSDVCIGEQIDLTTPAVAGATYSWTGPNGFASSVQNPSIPNSTLAMSGTYNLVISTGADCPSNPGTVNIVVNPLPQPSLPQDGYICYNALTNVGSPYVLDAGLDNTTYDFEWFNNSGGTYTPVAGETQNSYTVSTPGAYAVRATNVVTGCVSPMVTANVGMSSPPLHVVAVSAEYFADVQSITVNVSPPGSYEYQLDNGAFQTGNIFSNLLPGTHTVTVRNECGTLSTSAYLMDFPRFFTPNGDGYNDTWNIFALNTQAKAKIYIFDRYGKLIKQISPGGKGWDGTLNAQILPSTDYWFTVEYEENSVRKEFKSHFALKR